jgi:hypothetical protein
MRQGVVLTYAPFQSSSLWQPRLALQHQKLWTPKFLQKSRRNAKKLAYRMKIKEGYRGIKMQKNRQGPETQHCRLVICGRAYF